VVIQDLDLVGRIYIAVFIIPLCDRFTWSLTCLKSYLYHGSYLISSGHVTFCMWLQVSRPLLRSSAN
jgi:hypothetical protein